jgi:hypothetical protein
LNDGGRRPTVIFALRGARDANRAFFILARTQTGRHTFGGARDNEANSRLCSYSLLARQRAAKDFYGTIKASIVAHLLYIICCSNSDCRTSVA